MRIRMQWLLGVVLTIASAMPLFAQTPAMRARVDNTVAAFNGTPEQFEAYVQEAYAPALRDRATPERRREFLQRVQNDFGKIEMTAARHTSPTRVAISIKGSKGPTGTLVIDHEAAAPHKLTDLRFTMGEGEDERPAFAPVPVTGSMTAGELSSALDGYLGKLVKEDRFAGTVLVARDGKPVFEKSYGLANRADNVANTNATRYNLGSINKHFTRTAVAQLLGAGKLSLSDTIGTHIPDFPNEMGKKATLQQLVEMQGGLADFFGPEFSNSGKQRFRSNHDYYAFVAPKPSSFEPGTNRQYCNSCYIVLGEIVERVSGVPYEQYVNDNVFKRAGMQTAAFIGIEDIVPNVAQGYTRGGGDGPLRNNVMTRGARGSAAGGAYATARDILALDESLRTGKLLDPQRTAWFFDLGQPASGRIGKAQGYAGGSPGVNAAVSSGETWSVVVLTNLDPGTADVAGAIYKALSGK